MSNKIWYLPGPFHQYQEDVKALAKKAGLRIIDASATASRVGEAKDVPAVTVKQVARSVVESQLMVPDQAALDQEELIGKLRAESGAIRVLIESAEGLVPLEHPEAGELPIRLFDALTAIHAGIQSLRDDREVEVEKSRTLQKQVDDLLSQAEQARLETDESKEAKEVAELKTKLDVAGITYRANASKESLQKQVDELPKS